MTVPNDGDSMAVDASAFGFGETVTTVTNATSVTEQDAPVKEDPVTTSDADEKDTSEESSVATPKEQETDPEERKRAEESHRMIIDTIEEKLTDRRNGDLSDNELRAWFEKHPEFADVANRSKRVKEEYRRFMETPVTTPKTPTPTETPAVEKETDDNQPLSRKDFLELMEQREETLLKKQYERQNTADFEQYAKSHEILGDNAQKLRSAADALFRVNPDWTFTESIQAAHRALYAGKSDPVSSPAGVNTPSTPVVKEGSVDLSQWTSMNSKDFMGS